MAQPKLLFYLKAEVLEVYSDQTEGSANFTFPLDIVRHQEVRDGKGLTDNLEKFFSDLSISELPIIILISKALLYSKQLAESQTGIDRNLIEDFLDSVPFDNSQLAKLELSGQDSVLVVATNRLLYQKIMEAAQSVGGRVEAVVPEIIFNLQTSVLSPQDVKEIFADKKNLESANFLVSQAANPIKVEPKVVENPEETAEGEKEQTPTQSKWLIILGTLFILGGLVVLGFMTKLINNPFMKSETPKVNTPQASASPQARVTVSIGSDSAILVSSQSATLKKEVKERLLIQIVNGIGIAGQSTRVKEILTKLGYSNIDIANTQITGESKSLVDFSKRVSPDYRQELIKSLQDIFATVSAREASSSAKYDVTVTTGIYK